MQAARVKRSRPSLTDAGVSLGARPVDTWASHLLAQLLDWLAALHALHPACTEIPPEVAVLALGIYREYAKATGLTQQYVVVQPLVTLSVTGVCLWVAIKFLANPGYVPSSLYMARATGVPHNLLVYFEPEVLRAVRWDILGVYRRMSVQQPPAEAEVHLPTKAGC